jgi:hypothetical protein
LVIEFGFWALAWGAGGETVAAIRDQARLYAAGLPAANSDGEALTIGTKLIGLVLKLIHTVTVAFRYAFFWCTASAIYLLLRMDVDEKEMDEVYLDDEHLDVPPLSAAPSTATAADEPEQPLAPPQPAGEPER